MKRITTLFAVLLCANTLFAGSAENIEPKTKSIRSKEWYATQAAYWKKEALSSTTEAAWINYYTASRYALAPQTELNEIEALLVAKNSDAFAANLVTAWNDGYSATGYAALTQALMLKPSDVWTNALMTMFEEYNGNEQSRHKAVKSMLDHEGFSVSLLYYSYNVLMSVDENGVLFTDGDNTTLPIFLLQDVFQVRNDVQVLNLDLLLNQNYREQKLQRSNIRLSNFTPSLAEADLKKRLCELLPEQNPDKKFYYSLTIGQQPIADIKDKLYVVGLASQISGERFDNISVLKQNLETRFLLDNLTVDFDGESEFASGKVLSGNYLVPILLLFEHYSAAGEAGKLSRWEHIINNLAKEESKQILVRGFLSKEAAPKPFVAAGIDFKRIEGMMKHVRENIYAYETEVTNAEYNSYLKYLNDTNQKSIFDKVQIDLSQYEDPALTYMKTYHAAPVVTKKKKYFTEYPVVNVPYEGAQAYCDWLTEQYNNTPDRKYKKVKFRLPAVNEWQIAALGYKKAQSWNIEDTQVEMIIPKDNNDEICKSCPTKLYAFKESDILYPWFGSYNFRNKALNSRGCALGNFKFPESVKPCLPTMPTPDGWTMMSPVQAYFPNGIGLYDVVGNVAEMTIEKGKACGGSWNHFPAESTIISINEYTGPDSRIGFRPFMEVIEN